MSAWASLACFSGAMAELLRGLSQRALAALADLEHRTLAVDGGRLKLEWGMITSPAGGDLEAVLEWDGDRLVGFAGLYAFGAPTVELAGMVDPSVRRRGIATALLDVALPHCRERGYERALLVTPRPSAAGRSLALRRGAVLDHCEHALVMTGEPPPGETDPRISLRAATPTDGDEVDRLLMAGFNHAPSSTETHSASRSARTLVGRIADSTVATVRLERHGDTGAVYGFVVDPAWQGQGIGRDLLLRVCRLLRAEGVTQIRLEVAVDNERALRLYTSLGFVPTTTEDYYSLSLA